MTVKQAIITIIILTILCYVWLFPKIEASPEIHQEAQKIPLYCIIFEGAIDVEYQRCFVDSISLFDVLHDARHYISKDADLSKFQHDETIRQSKTIYIPKTTASEPVVHGLLDVNKASFQDLMRIPGITETRAASIIIHREMHGKFNHLDELIHVKHIGVVTLEKIKPYLKV